MSVSRMLLPLLLLPGLLLAQQSGLAIVGGDSPDHTSAEFWAPAPGELHCTLPSFTGKMYQPTLDSWEGSLITCYDDSCDQLPPTGWQHWRKTLYGRQDHTAEILPQTSSPKGTF